jgi:hypothetical protein
MAVVGHEKLGHEPSLYPRRQGSTCPRCKDASRNLKIDPKFTTRPYRDITRYVHRDIFIEKLTEKCNTPSSSFWPNFRRASTTNSRLTSIRRGGNTGQLVNEPESPASKSSGVSSRAFGICFVFIWGHKQHRQCQRLPSNLASLELPGRYLFQQTPRRILASRELRQ